MIAGCKWSEIQPKCTLYVDYAAKEWAIYLTNSPEEELSMIGLDASWRDNLRFTQRETTPPIRNGIAFAVYHDDIMLRLYNGRYERPSNCNTMITTGVCNIREYLRKMHKTNEGRFWATFGGRKATSRLISAMCNPVSIKFIDKAGKVYTQHQQSQLETQELHERGDSVGVDFASVVMASATDGHLSPPMDEEQIECYNN